MALGCLLLGGVGCAVDMHGTREDVALDAEPDKAKRMERPDVEMNERLLGCPLVCYRMAQQGCPNFKSLEACYEVCESWYLVINPHCAMQVQHYFQCQGNAEFECSEEGSSVAIGCDIEGERLDACQSYAPG
jgi:hypothetical protein